MIGTRRFGDVFVVAVGPSGQWLVTCEARERAALFATRREALLYAQACAEERRPATVRVMDRRGTVEDEWAYAANRHVRRVGPISPGPM